MSEQSINIEKQIKLKELEIEQLRLQSELKTSSNKGLQNHTDLFVNILILVGVCIAFYGLQWGKSIASVDTNYGSQSYVSSNFTGFTLGLLTFSIPTTILNVLAFVFILKNNHKAILILALMGLLYSSCILINISSSEGIGTTFSGFFGSVSARIVLTTSAYFVPVCYLTMSIFNLTALIVANDKK